MVYLIGSQGFREELDEARIMYFGCGPDPPDGMDIDQENLLDKDAFIYRIGLDDPVSALLFRHSWSLVLRMEGMVLKPTVIIVFESKGVYFCIFQYRLEWEVE